MNLSHKNLVGDLIFSDELVVSIFDRHIWFWPVSFFKIGGFSFIHFSVFVVSFIDYF